MGSDRGLLGCSCKAVAACFACAACSTLCVARLHLQRAACNVAAAAVLLCNSVGFWGGDVSESACLLFLVLWAAQVVHVNNALCGYDSCTAMDCATAASCWQ
jgi:hypothetical protein